MTTGDPEALPVPMSPSLNGKHVYLRPVNPGDYPYLQHIELGSELAGRWRFRGATPAPETWAQAFWGTVLAQFLVIARDGDRPVGLVLAYRADFQDGHAYLAVLRFDPNDHSPLMLSGVALFLRYVFTCWNFRKLYMESLELNYQQFASGTGQLFEVEGRLRDHSYYAGRYWDQLILSIDRETWAREGERHLAAADQPPRPAGAWVRLPARSPLTNGA
jgi:RimJ/RimL family protein N-acetyltransferase